MSTESDPASEVEGDLAPDSEFEPDYDPAVDSAVDVTAWLTRREEGNPKKRGKALGAALVATGSTAAGLAVALAPERAGSAEALLILGAIYAALAGLAVVRMRRLRVLRERLAPRRGDITIGALLAVVGWGVARGGQLILAAPDSVHESWIVRLYVQIGEPAVSATFEAGFALLLVAGLEELVWRGGVQEALIDGWGPRRGWLLTSAFYVLAYAPTAWRLAVAGVGPNPLLVVAALGGGLVWGFLAMKSERLAPSIFAHALLTWAVVQFPLWRLGS